MLKITAKATKTTAFATAMALVSVAALHSVIERKPVERWEGKEQDSVMQSGIAYQVEKDQLVATLDGLRILSDKNSFVQAGVYVDLGSLGTSNVYTLTGKNSARALHFVTGQDRAGRLGAYADMQTHMQTQFKTSKRSAKFALAASGYTRKPVAKPRTVNELYEVVRTGESAPMDPVLKAAALASGAKIYTWTLSDDADFDAVAAFLNTDGFDSKEEEHAEFLAAIIKGIERAKVKEILKYNDTYPNVSVEVTLNYPIFDEPECKQVMEFEVVTERCRPNAPEWDEVTIEVFGERCDTLNRDDCKFSDRLTTSKTPINAAMSSFECAFIKDALAETIATEQNLDFLLSWSMDVFCEEDVVGFKRGMWWSVMGPTSEPTDSTKQESTTESDRAQTLLASMAFGFSSFNSPAIAFCDYDSESDSPLVIYELEIAPDTNWRTLDDMLDDHGPEASLTAFLADWRAQGTGKNVTLSSISFRTDDTLVTLEGQAANDLIATCSDAIIDP